MIASVKFVRRWPFVQWILLVFVTWTLYIQSPPSARIMLVRKPCITERNSTVSTRRIQANVSSKEQLIGTSESTVAHQLQQEWKRPNYSEELARTAESVAIRTSSGRRFVLVTTGSWAFREYVYNFACSLLKVSNHSLLLMAFDAKLAMASLPSNVRAYAFDNRTAGTRSFYGSAAFSKLSFRKLEAVASILAAGFDVLYADADTVWCTGSAPELIAKVAEGHIAFQYGVKGGHVMNTGLYYARSGEPALRFLAAVLNLSGYTEQHAAKTIACEGPGVAVYARHREYPDYCVWNRTTTLAVLDPFRFPIACTNIFGRMLLSHSNTTISRLCYTGTIKLMHYSCHLNDEKKKKMISNKMWFVRNEDIPNCRGRE